MRTKTVRRTKKMDTKALEKAEQATKTAVAEYEKLVNAETDYKAKIAAAKTTALNCAGEVQCSRFGGCDLCFVISFGVDEFFVLGDGGFSGLFGLLKCFRVHLLCSPDCLGPHQQRDYRIRP